MGDTRTDKPSFYNGINGRPVGGDSVAYVESILKQRVRVDKNWTPPDVKFIEPAVLNEEKKECTCFMCGRTYKTRKGNFLNCGRSSLLWQANGGYTPICKKCCSTLYLSLVDLFNGNEEHALKYFCCMFGLYYNTKVSAMTVVQARHMADTTRVTLYPSRIVSRNISLKGKSFFDTLKEDYGDGAVTSLSQVPSEEEVIKMEENGEETDSPDEYIVTKEMVKRWGKGFKPDEYEFLETEYSDWKAKNVCNTKAQEELYKNISLCQLDIRRVRETGGKMSDAQDALQKFMSSVNILPRQNADNVFDDSQTFGTLLEKYEKTKPLPEPSPEWTDVDGISKYFNGFIRGGLAKALKIKTENSAIYDEMVSELDKYTVHRAGTDQIAEGMGAAVFDTPENLDSSQVKVKEDDKAEEKTGGG